MTRRVRSAPAPKPPLTVPRYRRVLMIVLVALAPVASTSEPTSISDTARSAAMTLQTDFRHASDAVGKWQPNAVRVVAGVTHATTTAEGQWLSFFRTLPALVWQHVKTAMDATFLNGPSIAGPQGDGGQTPGPGGGARR